MTTKTTEVPQTLADYKATRNAAPEPVKAEESTLQEVAAEGKAEEPKAEPVKRNKIEERFSEVTAKTRAAIERAEAAERELSELKDKAKAAEPVPVEKEAKPDPKDFTDAFEYAEKLAEWSASQALAKRDKEDAEKKAAAEREKVVATWSERMAKIKDEFADYDEMIASSGLSVHDEVRDAIIESEHGPRILYLLASNDELAEQMKGGAKSVRAQLLQLGRLEASFDKAQTAAKVDPEEIPVAKIADIAPKRKAPEPITPVRGSKTETLSDTSEFKGSYSQYKAQRMREISK